MPSIDFHPLSFDDLTLLRRYLPHYGTGDCNLSLASLLMRGPQRGVQIAEWQNHLFIDWTPIGFDEGFRAMQFPLGCCASAELLAVLEAQALNAGRPLRLYGIIPDILLWLQKLAPERSFRIECASAGWDYLYRREAIERLEGRPLAKKRNFARRYRAANPTHDFVALSRETIPMAGELLERWYAEEPGGMTPSLEEERRAIRVAFAHWEDLGLLGGLLISEGRVDGLTFGAMASPQVFAVHIEKARREVTGAYQALASELAASLPAEAVFLNREEDLGIPGLRKAKLSWAPCGMLQKGVVTLDPEQARR